MKTIRDIKKEIQNSPEMSYPGIYMIKESGTNRVYIGQTKLPIATRLIQHLDSPIKDPTSIDGALKVKGADKFEYLVVIPMLQPTEEELNFQEVRLIEVYDSLNKGYNKTVGNHKAHFVLDDFRKAHIIDSKVTREIVKEFKLDFRDQKVLLIGTFNNDFIGLINHEADKVVLINSYTDGKKDLNEQFKLHFDEELEKMENKDFDIIISNPPYGKIGCEITKKIIDEIEFKDFINLLPVNDYIKRGKKYNLWQYVANPKDIFIVSFADAVVTSHCAKIQKTPNRFMSAEEFEIESFSDPSLNKFFYENNNRKHYAIDKVPFTGMSVNKTGVWDVNKTIIFGDRDMAHGHMPYSKEVDTYKWNVEKSIDFNYLLTNCICKGNRLHISNIDFETEIEKENFAKFMYSDEGFRFYAKLWTSMHIDGGVRVIGLIKVDWTKEWTLEEILKDYGYSKKEIAEVVEDLKNFKGIGE